MTHYYPILILICNIILSSVVNIIIDVRIKNDCNKINSKDVKTFAFLKKSKKFKFKSWNSIVPGDIIKVKENEEFPADVLILDAVSNQNHKCYVRGGINEDINMPTLKKSCEGTSNKTG
jgi:magnesium-transporting ATPase (P-type)